MPTPTWLDTTAYPFESHYADVLDGRMHYVDEGSGETILMIHGTPTWSFLYRHLISGLSANYRVIALDHLGFGLSDKPTNYSYRPQDQARNVAAFIDGLGLQDFTLVVHDFGGPIGLSYALDNPQAIRRLVVFNTWLWPLQDDFSKVIAGNLFSSPLGRWLFMRHNLEVNRIFPFAFGDRAKLTPAIHAHYRGPAEDPTTREAIWVYARELLKSRDWYASLWEKRTALNDIPMLLAWGLKDPVIGPPYFKRWQQAFPHAQTVTFPQTEHYLQEEQGAALVPVVSEFMGG